MSIVLYTHTNKYKMKPPILEYNEEKINAFSNELHMIDVDNLDLELINHLLNEIINKPDLACYIDNDYIQLFFELMDLKNVIDLNILLETIYIILMYTSNISTIDRKDNIKRIHELYYIVFQDENQALIEVYCAVIVQVINKFKHTKILQTKDFILNITTNLEIINSLTFLDGILRKDILEETQKGITEYLIENFIENNILIYTCMCQVNINEEIIAFYMIEDKWINDLYNPNHDIMEYCWKFVNQIVSKDINVYGPRIIDIITNNPITYDIAIYIYELLCIFSCFDDEHIFSEFFKIINSGMIIENLIEDSSYGYKRSIMFNLKHISEYIGYGFISEKIVSNIIENIDIEDDDEALLCIMEYLLHLINNRKDLNECILSCGKSNNINNTLDVIMPDLIRMNQELYDLIEFFNIDISS